MNNGTYQTLTQSSVSVGTAGGNVLAGCSLTTRHGESLVGYYNYTGAYGDCQGRSLVDIRKPTEPAPSSQFKMNLRHIGIDFVPVDNLAVHPIVAGTLVEKNSTEDVGYGYYAIVQHSDSVRGTFYILYAHMTAPVQVPYGSVTTGTILGTAGETGAALGVHVHLEVRRFSTAYNSALKDSSERSNAYGIEVTPGSSGCANWNEAVFTRDWIDPETL